jgi:Rrf2 family transcriptional regulator, iron-sulfur cluster assembly transcription factor
VIDPDEPAEYSNKSKTKLVLHKNIQDPEKRTSMQVIRQHTDYALRLLVELGRAGSDRRLSARGLAKAAKVSYYYTAKILQTLRGSGLVASTMGKRGGFSLAVPPGDITLSEVVEALQGPVRLNQCLLPVGSCTLRGRCPISGAMAKVQQQLEDSLEAVTLEDILKAKSASPKSNLTDRR